MKATKKYDMKPIVDLMDEYINKLKNLKSVKLELKHLAPYLPYGLKIKDIAYPSNFEMSYENITMVEGEYYKPILRPLSDLTKEIEHNGEKFVPDLWAKDKNETMYFEDDFLRGITRRNTEYDIKQCSFNVIQKLFEWHFDVFNLIEQNLAIDINKINS